MWEGKGVVKTARQMLGETDPVSSKNWVINCEIPWLGWCYVDYNTLDPIITFCKLVK